MNGGSPPARPGAGRRTAGGEEGVRSRPETDPRRALPGVDRLLEIDRVREWLGRWGREPVRSALRAALARARAELTAGATPPTVEELLGGAEARLEAAARASLRRVLNATGVVLHTNLGRAPLAREALDSLTVAAGYANLEYDLAGGARGSRHDHCTALLRELTGAEAALVVNNNAAAVALAVNEFALGRQVVVSRGELVEIGGSFRIPEIIRRAGARPSEVGATNRTRLEDYATAIGRRTGLLLKVHPSNYRLVGFTGAVPLSELVALGRERGVPVLHDLGSGLLSSALLPGFPEEPAVRASVEEGADLVCFSGDKLLGGPQAGILVGSAEAVSRLRRNPLLRAFRVDKLTLAALEATLRLHRDAERAAERVPVLHMLREPVAEVEGRARRALERDPPPLPLRASLCRMQALPGGGSFPEVRLSSAGWRVTGAEPERVEAACRGGDPPLVGRVGEGCFWLDFRTLLPGEEVEAARALRRAAEALRADGNVP